MFHPCAPDGPVGLDLDCVRFGCAGQVAFAGSIDRLYDTARALFVLRPVSTKPHLLSTSVNYPVSFSATFSSTVISPFVPPNQP